MSQGDTVEVDKALAEFQVVVSLGNELLLHEISEYLQSAADYYGGVGGWNSFKAEVLGDVRAQQQMKSLLAQNLKRVSQLKNLDIGLLKMHQDLVVDALQKKAEEIEERLGNNGKSSQGSEELSAKSLKQQQKALDLLGKIRLSMHAGILKP